MEQKVEFVVPSECGMGNCVGVAITEEAVYVRDTKESDGPVLGFTHDEWSAFCKAVNKGEFATQDC